MSERRPTVLVADNEPAIVDGHAARLEDDYAIRRAYGGREALDRIDEYVDVAVLDRRMPDLDGDVVLERARRQGYGCRIAMLTGVEPGFDVLEIGFDDYLQKPVRERKLRETVERLCRWKQYDEGLQELFSLASRAAALEAEHDQETLEARQGYRSLRNRLEDLRADLEDQIEHLPADDRYTVAVNPVQAQS